VRGISAWHNELTGVWWSSARTPDNLDRAPEFIRPLIRGDVERLEAAEDQISAALEWAASIAGWEPLPADFKPLHIFEVRYPSIS
jgi:hypothetical protein